MISFAAGYAAAASLVPAVARRARGAHASFARRVTEQVTIAFAHAKLSTTQFSGDILRRTKS